MPAPSNPDVAWAIEDIRANLPAREKALRYWKGDHPLNFATTKFRNTFGELFAELSDNLCDDVVNEPTDRLQILNWMGAGEEELASTVQSDGSMSIPKPSPIAQRAQEWWDDNRGDARSGSVHLHGFRAGDGFVIVWDNGDDIPRPYVQDPRQMAVRYSASNPDEIEVAAKCWRVGKGFQLNLYYANRVEHFYSKGWSNISGEKGIPNATAFQPLARQEIVDDTGRVVQDAMEAVEVHDHGMPVFHFPNGELSQYGQSVLADVYPLQDALNKILCDFMVAGEGSSLPKRFFSGIQVLTDPVTGEEISPFKDGTNTWWSGNKDASGIQFPAAEMTGFLESMRSMRLEIGRKGGLPPHSVNADAGGNAPSGLSLLIAEGKLIKRCKDRQRDWGVVWRELVAYALTWMGSAVTSKDLAIAWAPVETRDEKALLEALALKSGLGVPQVQLLREAGYTEEQIIGFGLLNEQDQARKLDQAQAMSGGRISTPPPGTGSGTPDAPAPPAGGAQPAPPGVAA